MANPNIVDVTTILGNTTTVSATTSFQTLVNNKASSGKIMKVKPTTDSSMMQNNMKKNMGPVVCSIIRAPIRLPKIWLDS